jgi:SAM-dependent methyltransferase
MSDPDVRPATPLRGVECAQIEGVRLLGESGLTYRDGGESEVLQILRSSTDLSSASDELVARAGTWATRYHLDPARSNVLRSLALRSQDSVLEVGAGCGALTRYLGERCKFVDAIEPMPERARCARERSRDLANVEVFVGLLEDVPVKRAYDVVVVVGVLEYVGRGSADPIIYSSFLKRAASLLREGGTLVLAIENRLGVKYMVGAPEDHSGRQFEGIEGYDETSIARTFSRRELEGFVIGAGLAVTTFGAFPDYKMTRSVMHDELFSARPTLAVTTPQFPSPDWNVAVHRLANEARAWRNLVEAGLGPETANSLLILGHRGDGPSPLWPEGTLMAYYSPYGRRSIFAFESRVRRAGDGLEVVRRPILPGPHDGRLRVQSSPERFVDGKDYLEVIIDADSRAELGHVLVAWRDALDRTIEVGAVPHADLLPHNAVRTGDGSIVFIDSKWDIAGYDRDAVVQRAAFVLAQSLSIHTSANRWPAATLRDLAVDLGTLVGLDPESEWLDGALRREATLQATLNTPRPTDADFDAQVDRIENEYRDWFDSPLTSFGGQSPDELIAEIGRARQELREVYATRLFRYARLPRTLYARFRAGSRSA